MGKGENMKGEHNAIYITYNGKTQTKADWARELNTSRQAFHARYNRYHGDMDKVTAKPFRKAQKHTYKGNLVTIREMSELNGLTESGTWKRLCRGLSDDDTIELPKRETHRRITTESTKQKPIGCKYPECDDCPYPDCAW